MLHDEERPIGVVREAAADVDDFRVTLLFPLTTAIVFRTVTLIVTAPQRSAWAAGPETLRVTTTFFGVVAPVAATLVAATALAVGSAIASAPRTEVIVRFTSLLSSQSAKRSVWM